MNKIQFEMINNNIKKYRKSVLCSTLYITIFIFLFSIIFLTIIYSIKNNNILLGDNKLIILLVFIININIIILLLIFKGKEINKILINSSLYFEYRKIINKEPIKIKVNNKSEFISKLKFILRDNKYKIIKVNESGSIILEAKKNKLSIMLLTTYLVRVYFFEKLTMSDLKKVLLSSFKKTESTFRATISHIILLSNDLEEEAKEFLNYSLKINEGINKYVIPISMNLTNGDVYFKKTELIFGSLLKNEINYITYKLFDQEKQFKLSFLFYKFLIFIFNILILTPILYLYYVYKQNLLVNFKILGLLILLIFLTAIISSFDFLKKRI